MQMNTVAKIEMEGKTVHLYRRDNGALALSLRSAAEQSYAEFEVTPAFVATLGRMLVGAAP